MKESWRKEMQQKLTDYEQQAPPLDWAAVEHSVAGRRRKARMVPIWLSGAAAAAAVVVALTVGHRLSSEGPADDNLAEAATPVKTEALRAGRDQREAECVKEVLRSVSAVARGRQPKSSAVKPHTTEQTDIQKAASVVDTDSLEGGETHATGEGKPATNTAMRQNGQRPSTHTAASAHGPQRRQPYEPRLTAKLYLSNSLAGGDIAELTSTPVHDNSPMNDPQNGATNNGPDYSNGEGQEPILPSGTELTESVRHRQPIRFGLSLRYCLDDRWSVETGLTYTLLRSDVTTTAGSLTATTEQSLTYLGIPMRVGCRLWSNSHLSVYATAGGMVEKMVRGRLTTDGQQQNISQRAPLFSLNGAVGLEYKFNDQLGLYCEPALEYHFANGSELHSIYLDQPVSLSAGLGIRITIK
ncbi:MAG: porin family protein [Prevotella sp.]|nr:porin family protein [Prevotella sp.]